MAAPTHPVDGMFYIDNAVDSFYLRETGIWSYKGRLFRANIVGLWGEGPFLSLQQYELARTLGPVFYSQTTSAPYSSVTAEFGPIGAVDLVFTDNLGSYLANGDSVICTAHFEPNSHGAILTFATAVIAAGAPTWIVLPSIPDPGLAGLRVLIGGLPA